MVVFFPQINLHHYKIPYRINVSLTRCLIEKIKIFRNLSAFGVSLLGTKILQIAKFLKQAVQNVLLDSLFTATTSCSFPDMFWWWCWKFQSEFRIKHAHLFSEYSILLVWKTCVFYHHLHQHIYHNICTNRFDWPILWLTLQSNQSRVVTNITLGSER